MRRRISPLPILFSLSLLTPLAALSEPMATLEESEHAANLEALSEIKERLETTIRALEEERPAEPARGKEVRRTGGGKIVNGVLTASFPAAGAMIKGADADSASPWCTGTLIGCQTFLTAAHCTRDHDGTDVRADETFVYFQHAGIYEVAEIVPHAGYTDAAFPDKDIAILRLARPVDGIRPISLQPNAVPDGSGGLIVGFGRSGGFNLDYGIKRRGIVRTAACTSGLPDGMLCWDFNAPVGLPGEDSNTCNADSGGPLFVQALDANLLVAGVTSGGSQSSCLAGDHSYDTDVHHYSAWIQEHAGSDLGTAACGATDVESDGVQIFAASSQLDPGRTSQQLELPVTASMKSVRIAMNAEDPGNGATDFDLFVREGSPATSEAEADCSRTGSGQFAWCEITPQGDGIVFINVMRKRGSGLFQVTATTLE